jgi:hypothetical protein
LGGFAMSIGGKNLGTEKRELGESKFDNIIMERKAGTLCA